MRHTGFLRRSDHCPSRIRLGSPWRGRTTYPIGPAGTCTACCTEDNLDTAASARRCAACDLAAPPTSARIACGPPVSSRRASAASPAYVAEAGCHTVLQIRAGPRLTLSLARQSDFFFAASPCRRWIVSPPTFLRQPLPPPPPPIHLGTGSRYARTDLSSMRSTNPEHHATLSRDRTALFDIGQHSVATCETVLPCVDPWSGRNTTWMYEGIMSQSLWSPRGSSWPSVPKKSPAESQARLI